MTSIDTESPVLAATHEKGPSLRLRIMALEVGETLCLAQRIPIDTATKEAMDDAQQKLMNIAGPAVGRAQISTGNTYTRDRATTQTARRDPVVCVLITRET